MPESTLMDEQVKATAEGELRDEDVRLIKEFLRGLKLESCEKDNMEYEIMPGQVTTCYVRDAILKFVKE